MRWSAVFASLRWYLGCAPLGPNQFRTKTGAVMNFKQCGLCATTGLAFSDKGDLEPCRDCNKTGWIEWAAGSAEPQMARAGLPDRVEA